MFGAIIKKITSTLLLIALIVAGAHSTIELNRIRVEHALVRAQVSLSFTDSACSGTYVGHNTVLTAEHCLGTSETHDPSFEQSSGDPVKLFVSINEGRMFPVKHVEYDGADHVLLTVDAYSPNYLRIDQSNYFRNGEPVVAAGHPGGRSAVEIERGAFIGREILREDGFAPVDSWDLAGQPGDSGEALVDPDTGLVKAVLSMGGVQNILLTIPLNFTAQQLTSIK